MKKLDEILDMCPNFYDRESFANGYLKGYQQAEKDLELTLDDILNIFSISEQLKTSWWFRDNEQTKLIGTQVFWEEVLKRFIEQRNEDKNVGTLNI